MTNPRSPLNDATVQLCAFDEVASDDADAELLRQWSALTELQRQQARWSVASRILKERGIKSLAQRLHMVGEREFGPGKFSADSRHALTAAVKGEAGPDVTAAAKALFDGMTDKHKAAFYPPKYWG